MSRKTENDVPDVVESHSTEEESVNGDHFVISLVLIGVVVVASVIFTLMQGGSPF